MSDNSHVIAPSSVLTPAEYQAAVERGARDFRERASAILSSEEAKWSPRVAEMLILETDISVEEALKLLSAIPSPQRDAALAARTLN